MDGAGWLPYNRPIVQQDSGVMSPAAASQKLGFPVGGTDRLRRPRCARLELSNVLGRELEPASSADVKICIRSDSRMEWL